MEQQVAAPSNSLDSGDDERLLPDTHRWCRGCQWCWGCGAPLLHSRSWLQCLKRTGEKWELDRLQLTWSILAAQSSMQTTPTGKAPGADTLNACRSWRLFMRQWHLNRVLKNTSQWVCCERKLNLKQWQEMSRNTWLHEQMGTGKAVREQLWLEIILTL